MGPVGSPFHPRQSEDRSFKKEFRVECMGEVGTEDYGGWNIVIWVFVDTHTERVEEREDGYRKG